MQKVNQEMHSAVLQCRDGSLVPRSAQADTNNKQSTVSGTSGIAKAASDTTAVKDQLQSGVGENLGFVEQWRGPADGGDCPLNWELIVSLVLDR